MTHTACLSFLTALSRTAFCEPTTVRLAPKAHCSSPSVLLTQGLVPPSPARVAGPPKDIPPPTPLHFPDCRPRAASLDSAGSGADGSGTQPPAHLTTVLQGLVRPADQVGLAHLEALGVHVNPDVSLSDLIPDSTCLPDFDKWDTLSREEVHAVDAESRPRLCNDRLAPGAAKYVDLRQGLLTENDRAFRAVRRVAPKPGEQYVRLGYCHDFFRHLEALTGFWEDTSATNSSARPEEQTPAADGEEASDKAMADVNSTFCRTSAGSSMPVQYRTQLLASFLKLVTYDFSCTVASRQEPRLYIRSPTPTRDPTGTIPAPRHSYFSSGCNFIFRMPIDRESAKHGIVEGPIAAVSPRHTLLFPPIGKERESVIDLSREVVAALITAQHRAREGRQEARIGRDAWWATKRRWGGGSGGPIGREAEALESKDGTPLLLEDKDERPDAKASFVEGEGAIPTKDTSSLGAMKTPSTGSRRSYKASFGGRSTSGNSPAGKSSPTQPPNPKRPRKSLPVYDAYRMVRPPSMHWDPKTRYAAIGRQRGADYDDVFVISCLFHHMSILRVRVPDRLLAVLSGESSEDPGVRGRGKLEVWRTRWYDFFIAHDRVEAMRAVWGVVAYAMRSSGSGAGRDEMDVDESGVAVAGSEGKKGNQRR